MFVFHELDDEEVPETQFHVGDDGGQGRQKKRAHKRKPTGEARTKTPSIGWSANEEMNLAKAWLEVTEDPKASKLYFNYIFLYVLCIFIFIVIVVCFF